MRHSAALLSRLMLRALKQEEKVFSSRSSKTTLLTRRVYSMTSWRGSGGCSRKRCGTLLLIGSMLGSNDPNTIPDPTRIRCSRSRTVFYVSARTPLCFGLSYDLCFSRTLLLSGYVSRDFVDICFMFYLSLLPYVSLARTMSSFSPSRTPQLPSPLVYCTSLIVLRSRSRIPLQRIRSLVYIPPVLVATTSELILLTSPSSLSEVLRNARILRLGSGRLCLLCSHWGQGPKYPPGTW